MNWASIALTSYSANRTSGCTSWGVAAAGERWFVKRAETDAARSLLTNALRFHGLISHEAIVRPLRVFDADALMLVYPWVRGTVLNSATIGGSDRSGLRRLHGLDAQVVDETISTVLDAHRTIAAHGYVAVDFYDGCLLFDFDKLVVRLIDFDEYRSGPFVLDRRRQSGSKRYMAPEELQFGATIDERTTVFNLGRLIGHLLDSPTGWRGTPEQAALAGRATAASPQQRFATVADLHARWIEAIR